MKPKKSAIQPDVENKEVVESKENTKEIKEVSGSNVVGKNNPRDKIFEELADKHDDFSDQEANNAEPESTETESPKDSETPEPTEVETDPTGTVESEPSETEEEPEELVTIKVDGVEQQVPKSKILDAGIRSLQKESTADKRLEEATRLKKEVEELVNEARKRDVEKPSQPSPSDLDEAELARLIQTGTPEQAADALRVIQQRAQHVAVERVSVQMAGDAFKRDFPDIVKDPYLMAIAQNLEQQKRKEGDKRPYAELYSDIGKEIISWRDKNAPPKAPDKTEKKRTVINIPSASKRQTPPNEEDQEESTTSIIAGMRKQRGQA